MHPLDSPLRTSANRTCRVGLIAIGVSVPLLLLGQVLSGPDAGGSSLPLLIAAIVGAAGAAALLASLGLALAAWRKSGAMPFVVLVVPATLAAAGLVLALLRSK